MNNKGTLKHHINQTRGKCEASLQAIMSIAKHRHIREKEMFTIMKLHEACTMPIYAAVWHRRAHPNKNGKERTG